MCGKHVQRVTNDGFAADQAVLLGAFERLPSALAAASRDDNRGTPALAIRPFLFEKRIHAAKA
jgi:hypothetical protein